MTASRGTPDTRAGAGIAPASASPGVGEKGATESWGRGARFGIVPIGHGEIYWLRPRTRCPAVRDGEVGVELRQRFAGWHRPVAALLEVTPPRASSGPTSRIAIRYGPGTADASFSSAMPPIP